jgi:hypothetical protein
MIPLIPNLVFLYHCIVASERLLERAVERSTGDLEAYFRAHLEEERGHDEWLAQDLASVGVDVKKTQIPVEAMEMVGCVYYLIEHVDPVALLGYMNALERSPDDDLMTRFEKNYPPSLLRTLRYHAFHDREHARDIRNMILKATPTQQQLITQTYTQTILYFQRALQKVAA